MIKGKLLLYFETGMEGCEWAVIDKDERSPNPYKALKELKKGDKLKIYDSGKIIWEGEIRPDTKTNLTDKTGYPYPRQVVKNYIVHWLQQGVDPEKWAQWFLEEKDCELEKRKSKNNRLEEKV